MDKTDIWDRWDRWDRFLYKKIKKEKISSIKKNPVPNCPPVPKTGILRVKG